MAQPGAGTPDDQETAIHSNIEEYKYQVAAFTDSLERCHIKYGGHHNLLVTMRHDIMLHALLYRGHHLQVANVFIKEVSDLMDYYRDLDFDTFKEQDTLDKLAGEAKKFCERVEMLVKLHTCLATDIDQVKEFALVREKLELEIENKCKEQVQLKQKIGNVSCFAKVGKGHLAHLLTCSEERMMEAQLEAWEVEGPMCFCIQKLLALVTEACIFFSRLHTELEKFSHTASNVQNAADDLAKLKLHHKLLIALKMKKVVDHCNAFSAAMPFVEARLERLTEANTTNIDADAFIKGWLKGK